jgi:hypothetical protein
LNLPKVNWFIWRVVLDGVATLQEIETHWSIDDLADAHEALDARDAVRREQLARARRSGGAR